jgi:hypothetical protein
MLYNISDLFLNKESHYGEFVREFHFTLCIWLADFLYNVKQQNGGCMKSIFCFRFDGDN